MVYQYVVTLKKDSERTINFISILLCLFSALNFLNELIRNRHINYFLLIAALVILAGTGINIVISRGGRSQVIYKYWLLIAAVGWLSMPYLPWLGALFVVLTFLEYQAKRPLEIGFDRDRVVINTLIKQRHDWPDFNNVILKDGLLTLDFKSNKLFQKEVMDDEEGEADEEEFNAYCRERMTAAGSALRV